MPVQILAYNTGAQASELWQQNDDGFTAQPTVTSALTALLDQAVSGNLVTANSVVQLPLSGLVGCGFAVSGTWAGTLVIETSPDVINWSVAQFYQQSDTTMKSAMTANQRGIVALPTDATFVRMRRSVATSGTAVVTLRGTAANTLVQMADLTDGRQARATILTGWTGTNLGDFYANLAPGLPLLLVASTPSPLVPRTHLVSTAVTVGLTATLVLVSRIGTRSVVVRNNDPVKTCWIVPVGGVAPNGMPLRPGEILRSTTNDAIYGATDSVGGSSLLIAVLEEWDG